MKDSFIFYRSFYVAMQKIKDKELKADIYDAICELGLNENVTTLTDDIGQMIMDLVTPQLVANNKRYQKGQYGVFGGRPREYDHDEIENLIILGLTNDEITAKIGCSTTLVKNIRQKVNNPDNNSQ